MNDQAGASDEPAILYFFDRTAEVPTDWPVGRRLVLVPMTVDQDLIDVVKDATHHLSQVTTVDFTSLFHDKSMAARSRFIEFIAAIADAPLGRGSSVKEILADRRHGFSSWWLSPIAVKSTLTSTSYEQLIRFLTIIDIQRQNGCGEIWLDTSDRQLARSLKINAQRLAVKVKDVRPSTSDRPVFDLFRSAGRGWLQLIKLAVKAITARWAMRGVSRARGLKNAEYLMVTYFPQVDKEALAEGRFLNKYYGPLQEQLDEKYPDKIAWLAMFVPMDGYSWRSSLRLGRRVSEFGNDFSFIEQWLTITDLASTALRAMTSLVKFIRWRGALETAFVFEDDDLSLNIWPLFESDWRDSFFGPGLIMGAVYWQIFQRVLSRLQPGTTLVYTAEMLAWERALNIAADQRGDLKVVGVQHTIVPLLLLNYFNHPRELREGEEDGLPQPDYLACVGRTTERLFLDCGWDPKKVFIWGAIRFQHFKRYLDEQVDWLARENKIIIALSISPKEGEEVLRLAYHAFKDKVDYRVIIKSHPALPIQPLLESIKIELRPDIFSVSEEPLSKLLARAKALIVAQSSAALEGIALGCPVIVPSLPGLLDISPLSGISDLPIHVSSPVQLKHAVDQIVEGDCSPMREEACRSLIEEYCDFPDSAKEFLIRLEKLRPNERKAAG